MRTLRQKISFILIFVLLAILLLPVTGLAAETNNSVIPNELNNTSSEQILLSPDTTSWGNQAGTAQSNTSSSSQSVDREKAITNQILENQQNIQENTKQIQVQWKVKVAKESLKKLLKALDSPSNIQKIKSGMKSIGLGKYTGKIDGAVNRMKKEIGWLLAWEEVTMTNLQDKLSGALYDAGLPLGVARGVARLVIDLLL